MAGKKNLTIPQGSTFRYKFKVNRLEAGAEDPVDLSGCEVKMQIRPTQRSDRLFLDLYEEGYISIDDPVNGSILIDIPASVTRDLSFSKAVYDIQIDFPDGYIMRLIEGSVFLSPEVTR